MTTAPTPITTTPLPPTDEPMSDNAATSLVSGLYKLDVAAAWLREKLQDHTDALIRLDAVDKARRWIACAIADAGLAVIAPEIGDPYNPQQHEALVEFADAPVNSVIRVSAYGLIRGTRLVEHASVTISRGPTT